MMSYRPSWACVVLVIFVSLCPIQGAEEAAKTEAPPVAAEQVAEKSTDPFDSLKNIKLAEEVTLSFGGSVRTRYELQKNYDFDNHAAGQGTFWLLRTRLSMDFNYADTVRLFAEGQDSRIHDHDARTRPGAITFFEDQFDVHQLFVDIKPMGADGPLTLRAGRQELNYGDQRLIGSFAWNNVGRPYDGLKLTYEQGKAKVDAFYLHPLSPPADIERVSLDDTDWSSHLYGLYGQITALPDHVLEPYFIVHHEHDRTIVDSKGRLDNYITYTAGTRFVGKWSNLDYGVEGAGQWGHWGDDSHRAWAAHGRAGYTASMIPWKPRLGAEYNFASGDGDPTDNEHETFDNLFPTNHLHYGYMDFMNWSNMHNLRLNLKVKPLEKLALIVDYHFFWLDQPTDAWRNAGGVPLRPVDPTGKSGDYLGREIDFTAKYTINKHLNVAGGVAKFFPSDYVRNTGAHDSPEWAFVQLALSF